MRVMKQAQAVRIAIDCIKKRRQNYAFDANLYKAGVDLFRTKVASKEYDILTDAIKTLEEASKSPPLFVV